MKRVEPQRLPAAAPRLVSVTALGGLGGFIPRVPSACRRPAAALARGFRTRLDTTMALQGGVDTRPSIPAPAKASGHVSSPEGEAVAEATVAAIAIPPDARPHVLERFHRVDRPRPGRPEGAGLGLAVFKSTGKARGGETEAEGTPGRGRAFRARPPLAV